MNAWNHVRVDACTCAMSREHSQPSVRWISLEQLKELKVQRWERCVWTSNLTLKVLLAGRDV